MKNLWILLILPFMISCGTKDTDPIEEDYEKLFPFKEIEKPPVYYEDMTVQLCDPRMALDKYSYPGVEITDNPRQYTVTIECEFWEKNLDGSDAEQPESDFIVAYIDSDKQLKQITCKNKYNSSTSAEQMTIGKAFKKQIKVTSGYPMYLCVKGKGPRSSGIKAKIKASSEDKLVLVPELHTEQSQNEEGPNELKEPYCNYIILP